MLMAPAHDSSFHSQSGNTMIGVGLRHQHFDYITTHRPREVGWFEIISENFMFTEGRPAHFLEKIRRDYPLAMHGVSLSIAGTQPLAPRYLQKLKDLIQRIEPFIVSDHLCWTGKPEHNLHNLLPFPYTEENLQWIAARVQQVQDFIQRPLALENLSAYFSLAHSSMTEWEFLSQLSQLTGCQILLDINNVYVNARNQHFDPDLFLRHIPVDRISHFHLAGHSDMGTHLFDTHSTPVCDEVWELYRAMIARAPHTPTLIEWDEDIPEFPVLAAEAQKAHAQAVHP